MTKHNQWKTSERCKNRRKVRRETIDRKQGWFIGELSTRIQESF